MAFSNTENHWPTGGPLGWLCTKQSAVAGRKLCRRITYMAPVGYCRTDLLDSDVPRIDHQLQKIQSTHHCDTKGLRQFDHVFIVRDQDNPELKRVGHVASVDS